MRTLGTFLLMLLLVSSAENMLANRLPQDEKQNSSPQQQAQPTPPPGQAASSAAVQSVTGCMVKRDGGGYSLMADDGAYPIDTDQDLSNYVNKQVKITGILEHKIAGGQSATTGSPTTVTDIRLRMIATVIGDCNKTGK